MAVKANVPIIPISIYYAGDKIFSKGGELLSVTPTEGTITAITRLRETMATMKYEQMEACGVYSRTNAEKTYFETLIKASLDEYPTFNREYEETCVFRNNEY